MGSEFQKRRSSEREIERLIDVWTVVFSDFSREMIMYRDDLIGAVGLELADDDKKEATLDDVLNSLLGLPTANKSPARSPVGPPPVRTSSRRNNPVDGVDITATGS